MSFFCSFAAKCRAPGAAVVMSALGGISNAVILAAINAEPKPRTPASPACGRRRFRCFAAPFRQDPALHPDLGDGRDRSHHPQGAGAPDGSGSAIRTCSAGRNRPLRIVGRHHQGNRNAGRKRPTRLLRCKASSSSSSWEFTSRICRCWRSCWPVSWWSAW